MLTYARNVLTSKLPIKRQDSLMAQPDRTKIGADIFPLFIVRKTTPVEIVSFQGTGFLIAPNVLVTCWHNVNSRLEEDQSYALAVEGGAVGQYTVATLSNVSQDENGSDLATANVGLVPTLGLTLPLYEFPYRVSVWNMLLLRNRYANARKSLAGSTSTP